MRAQPGFSRAPPREGARHFPTGPAFSTALDIEEIHAMTESDYSTRSTVFTARIARALVFIVALLLTSIAPSLAQAPTPFSGGGKAGQEDPYASYTYTSAPAYAVYNNTLYLYGTAEDGKGYYTTYDGTSWSAYTSWQDQPTNYKWDPVSVEYAGTQYVYYTGEDNRYYQQSYDGQAWSGWNDTSGQYTFQQAPYANVHNNTLYLYGVATDGNVYGKSFDGTTWTEWAPVNDTYAAGAYQPYAVSWNNYENVFWVGQDGKAYWNRYDGTSWTGAKELTGDDTYAATPYATGYDGKLYAYATTADGAPYYNTFTEGQGWSGWTAYAAAPPAKVAYQPSTYVYNEKQHTVYTAEDGHAYYTSYDGTSWSEWTDLGPNYTYKPVQYEYGTAYYLAYTGQDGAIYYKTYSGDQAGGQQPTPTPGY